MTNNLEGERCPNGAGKNCICSREANKQREQAATRKRRNGKIDRFLANFVGIAGVLGALAWTTVDCFLVRPRAFEFGNLAKSLLVVASVWLVMRSAETVFSAREAEREIAQQEMHEMHCAIRMLAGHKSGEDRAGNDLPSIQAKLDSLLREVELMRRGE